MNEQFVTDAIQEDRYLKAIRMIDRFETEIREELERVGGEIVAANPEMFPDRVEPKWNNRRQPNPVIAFARVDYEMDRVSEINDNETLTFNLGIRWLDPGEYGHPEQEGALCVASYKIKHATRDEFDRCRNQTMEGDWPIQFTDDAYRNAPGVCYIPVEDADELKDAFETIKEHFATFGSTFGF